MAFYLAEMSGRDIRAGEPIAPEIQNEAVYLVSRASLDWISPNIPQTGPTISRLVFDLGDILREKLLKHTSEPEAARIVIRDPDQLENSLFQGLNLVLNDTVRWSVLHLSGSASAYLPRHKSDTRPREFTLNRIMIPGLKVSPRARWRTEFKVQEIDDLIDSDRRAKRKGALIRKQRGKVKKQNETQEIPLLLFNRIEDAEVENEQ